MAGIQCCGRGRDLVWIGMIPEPSEEEDVQFSGKHRYGRGECSRVVFF